MKRSLIAALLAAPLMAGAAPAQAQQGVKCGEWRKVIANLNGRHGESRIANLPQTVRTIEIYMNANTGTWTVLFTTPDGMTCMVAAGQDGEFEAPLVGEPA